MKEFLSAFLGGFLTLLGVVLTGRIQRKHKEENDKKDERNLIASIRCEVLALDKLLEERHGDILRGNLNENGFFPFESSVTSNYLSFFDGNMNQLLKIESEEIRLQIQILILYTRSYLDSLRSHSELLNRVVDYEFLHRRNIEDELVKERFSEYVRSLKSFDQSLIEQVKDLKDKIQALLPAMEKDY